MRRDNRSACPPILDTMLEDFSEQLGWDTTSKSRDALMLGNQTVVLNLQVLEVGNKERERCFHA